MLGFSAANAQHSSIAASGSVAISTGLLKLDFGALPALSSNFPNLITAPGTISGCFDEVAAAPPGVVAAVQCTTSGVSVVVKALDRLFAGGFNY